MSSAIARIVVDVALDREFDYRIPGALVESVRVGSRVLVPFGWRRTTGYVVGLADRSERADLKSVIEALGSRPVFDARALSLAKWIADYYCAPIEQVIKTILPSPVRHPKAAFKSRMFVRLTEGLREENGQNRPDGPAQATPPTVNREPMSHVQTSLSPKQQAVVAFLRARDSGVFLHELTRALKITVAPARSLARKGFVAIEDKAQERNPLADRRVLPTEPLTLMPEQAEALKTIVACVDRLGQDPAPAGRGVVLLHGVTGSGKTEVYLQAIAHVLRQGCGAIVLVPEISLTPQTVERFQGRFGDRIAVLHSHLSRGARHDEWHRVLEGKASIVIGARSAVFAPVRNPGLIVVDEEHETSYKQEEAPRYNARDVAVMRGRAERCAVVLGSATPSLESWHNARIGKYALTALPRRVDDRRMPVMRVVDMRMEKDGEGRHSVFSRALIEAIRNRLDRAEQTILFLNRRGFATSMICPRCGFVAKCDQCSVSYTYHRTEERLRCHICAGSRVVPPRCPGCQDLAFKFAGIGTQRVESILGKLFPHARVQRMDADVTTRKDSHERILGDFRVGKTDILVGTQMIAKGLHFPNVTLVGVIYADLSLHIADFRAGERTFQLLAQVAGRAGRGDVPGEVIVQTYTPFNQAIQAARRLDYTGFCDQELEFRRELNYPPFTHLVCVTVKGRSSERASYCAAALVRRLRQRAARQVMISDAGPAPLARAKGIYRFQIMARSASVKAMSRPVRETVEGFEFPKDITWTIDVDAISLL
ncbi:MAG: primosomal protein N' [Verrucomicrobiota bacterium]|nr:primosomal protein N' [Verrucomicrobiota bacterium]